MHKWDDQLNPSSMCCYCTSFISPPILSSPGSSNVLLIILFIHSKKISHSGIKLESKWESGGIALVFPSLYESNWIEEAERVRQRKTERIIGYLYIHLCKFVCAHKLGSRLRLSHSSYECPILKPEQATVPEVDQTFTELSLFIFNLAFHDYTAEVNWRYYFTCTQSCCSLSVAINRVLVSVPWISVWYFKLT